MSRTLLPALVLCSLMGCPGGNPTPEVDLDSTSTAPDGGGEWQDAVWGFADLHIHTMAHRGFGADDGGRGGLFHGSPGLTAEGSNPLRDLEVCDPGDHVHAFDADPVRNETRSLILSSSETDPTFLNGHEQHASEGPPGLAGWPHPRSLTHQMAHVDWLQRAHAGGLRLIVASAVDNELLDALWTRGSGAALPEPKAGFAYASARDQILAMKDMACANDDWMEIVVTSADARRAIKEGKLAVVLSAEMDTLTLDEIRALRIEGMAHVTPIHLTDNAFGGAAAYSDQFNALNQWVNGSSFQVVGDPDLAFRFTQPSELTLSVWPGVVGVASPNRVGCATSCALGYEPLECDVDGDGEPDFCDGIPFGQGHRNAKGLLGNGVKALLEEGMLVDVSHMSEEALEGSLELSEALGVPLMNTHGSLRPEEGHYGSERAMRRDHAARMAALGGVLGFGTHGDGNPRQFLEVHGGPLAQLTSDRPEIVLPLSTTPPGPTIEIDQLAATLRTTGDDLRGDRGHAFLTWELKDGSGGQRQIDPPGGLRSGSEVTLSVPFDGARLSQLASIGVETELQGGLFRDDWDLGHVVVTFEGTRAGVPVDGLLGSFGGRPLHRFTGGGPDRWEVRFDDRANLRERPLLSRSLRVRVTTGPDDLREGSVAELVVTRVDGQRTHVPLSSGLPSGAETTVEYAWPEGHVAVEDLATVDLVLHSRIQGFDTEDQWDLQELDLEVRVGSEWLALERLRGHGDVGLRVARSARIWTSPSVRVGPDDPVRKVWVTVETHRDDLRGGGNTLDLEIDTTQGTFTLEDVAHGETLAGWSRRTFEVDFGRSMMASELRMLTLVPDLGSGFGSDAWDVRSIELVALRDPVPGWTERYLHARDIFGEGQVALGTDLNGLSPQIAFSDAPATCDCTGEGDIPGVDVGLRVVDTAPPGTSWLPPHVQGSRTYDVTTDGIAHVGMLPDFVQAASTHPGGEEAARSLFRSAEAVIRMWERVETASGVVNDPSTADCPGD